MEVYKNTKTDKGALSPIQEVDEDKGPAVIAVDLLQLQRSVWTDDLNRPPGPPIGRPPIGPPVWPPIGPPPTPDRQTITLNQRYINNEIQNLPGEPHGPVQFGHIHRSKSRDTSEQANGDDLALLRQKLTRCRAISNYQPKQNTRKRVEGNTKSTPAKARSSPCLSPRAHVKQFPIKKVDSYQDILNEFEPELQALYEGYIEQKATIRREGEDLTDDQKALEKYKAGTKESKDAYLYGFLRGLNHQILQEASGFVVRGILDEVPSDQYLRQRDELNCVSTQCQLLLEQVNRQLEKQEASDEVTAAADIRKRVINEGNNNSKIPRPDALPMGTSKFQSQLPFDQPALHLMDSHGATRSVGGLSRLQCRGTAVRNHTCSPKDMKRHEYGTFERAKITKSKQMLRKGITGFGQTSQQQDLKSFIDEEKAIIINQAKIRLEAALLSNNKPQDNATQKAYRMQTRSPKKSAKARLNSHSSSTKVYIPDANVLVGLEGWDTKPKIPLQQDHVNLSSSQTMHPVRSDMDFATMRLTNSMSIAPTLHLNDPTPNKLDGEPTEAKKDGEPTEAKKDGEPTEVNKDGEPTEVKKDGEPTEVKKDGEKSEGECANFKEKQKFKATTKPVRKSGRQSGKTARSNTEVDADSKDENTARKAKPVIKKAAQLPSIQGIPMNTASTENARCRLSGIKTPDKLYLPKIKSNTQVYGSDVQCIRPVSVGLKQYIPTPSIASGSSTNSCSSLDSDNDPYPLQCSPTPSSLSYKSAVDETERRNSPSACTQMSKQPLLQFDDFDSSEDTQEEDEASDFEQGNNNLRGNMLPRVPSALEFKDNPTSNGYHNQCLNAEQFVWQLDTSDSQNRPGITKTQKSMHAPKYVTETAQDLTVIATSALPECRSDSELSDIYDMDMYTKFYNDKPPTPTVVERPKMDLNDESTRKRLDNLATPNKRERLECHVARETGIYKDKIRRRVTEHSSEPEAPSPYLEFCKRKSIAQANQADDLAKAYLKEAEKILAASGNQYIIPKTPIGRQQMRELATYGRAAKIGDRAIPPPHKGRRNSHFHASTESGNLSSESRTAEWVVSNPPIEAGMPLRRQSITPPLRVISIPNTAQDPYSP